MIYLKKTISERKWEDLKSISFDEALKHQSFENAIRLAYQLIFNKDWNDEVQSYGVELLLKIREKFPERWYSTWRYEAFLGLAFDIVLNYDKRFESFKKALEIAQKEGIRPPELLIGLAGCCSCPGSPPISYHEAIVYLKESISNYLYVDAVSLLRTIYFYMHDDQNEQYWLNILESIKDTNKLAPSLEPLEADQIYEDNIESI